MGFFMLCYLLNFVFCKQLWNDIYPKLKHYYIDCCTYVQNETPQIKSKPRKIFKQQKISDSSN